MCVCVSVCAGKVWRARQILGIAVGAGRVLCDVHRVVEVEEVNEIGGG